MANANLHHVTKFLHYLSFTVHYFYTWFSGFTQFFIHENYFELFLSAYFLFWEIRTLNLTFVVYVKLKHSCISNTVEPRTIFFTPVIVKYMERNFVIANNFGHSLGLSLYQGSTVSFNGYWPYLVADYSSEFHPQDSVDGTKPDERRGETKLQETGRKHGELCIFIWPHSSSPPAYQAVFLLNSILGIP